VTVVVVIVAEIASEGERIGDDNDHDDDEEYQVPDTEANRARPAG
jgi:hypothetical protein